MCLKDQFKDRESGNMVRGGTGMNKIAVIGKVFVDIKGTSFAPLHKDAKNVGDITFSNGGTGRNVAQNLAVLGNEVRFISTVTNDQIGVGVLDELKSYGANVDHVEMRSMESMPLPSILICLLQSWNV